MLLGISSIALADTVTVSIVNSQAVAIFVSFTTLNQAPGVITWNSSGSGCVNTGTSANAAYTQIKAINHLTHQRNSAKFAVGVGYASST